VRLFQLWRWRISSSTLVAIRLCISRQKLPCLSIYVRLDRRNWYPSTATCGRIRAGSGSSVFVSIYACDLPPGSAATRRRRSISSMSSSNCSGRSAASASTQSKRRDRIGFWSFWISGGNFRGHLPYQIGLAALSKPARYSLGCSVAETDQEKFTCAVPAACDPWQISVQCAWINPQRAVLQCPAQSIIYLYIHTSIKAQGIWSSTSQPRRRHCSCVHLQYA
jgi:hypothetical protein